MTLHAVPSEVKCPQCGTGPLNFLSAYGKMGDKYQCTNCKRTTIHCRRKDSTHCGLMALLHMNVYGEWKRNACRAGAQVGVE